MRALLILAIVYGLSSVVLGAFGAHALKAKLGADALVSYETGVRYQMIHAVVMIVIALWYRGAPSSLLVWSSGLMSAGILLFSGSIYLLSTRELTGLTWGKVLGPITPVGGLLLIVGWLIFLIWAIRQDVGSALKN